MAQRLGLKQPPKVLMIPARLPPRVAAFRGPPRCSCPGCGTGSTTPSGRRSWPCRLAHLRRQDRWIAGWRRSRVPLLVEPARVVGPPTDRAFEQCCDAWVVWALPDAVDAYADALVATTAFLRSASARLVGATGIGRITDRKETEHDPDRVRSSPRLARPASARRADREGSSPSSSFRLDSGPGEAAGAHPQRDWRRPSSAAESNAAPSSEPSAAPPRSFTPPSTEGMSRLHGSNAAPSSRTSASPPKPFAPRRHRPCPVCRIRRRHRRIFQSGRRGPASLAQQDPSSILPPPAEPPVKEFAAAGVGEAMPVPDLLNEPRKVDVCQPVEAEIVEHDAFSSRIEAAEAVEIRSRVAGVLTEGPAAGQADRPEGRTAVRDRPPPVRGGAPEGGSGTRPMRGAVKLRSGNLERARG